MRYRLKTSETDGSFDMRNLEIKVLFVSKTFSKFVLILVQLVKRLLQGRKTFVKEGFYKFQRNQERGTN